jgi:hypothetical protein
MIDEARRLIVAPVPKKRGASVSRFLLNLTEIQSHVTRKIPALNNAKPERIIASIALSLNARALNENVPAAGRGRSLRMGLEGTNPGPKTR